MNADNSMMSGFNEGSLITIKMFITSSAFPVIVLLVILWNILQWKIAGY